MSPRRLRLRESAAGLWNRRKKHYEQDHNLNGAGLSSIQELLEENNKKVLKQVVLYDYDSTTEEESSENVSEDVPEDDDDSTMASLFYDDDSATTADKPTEVASLSNEKDSSSSSRPVSATKEEVEEDVSPTSDDDDDDNDEYNECTTRMPFLARVEQFKEIRSSRSDIFGDDYDSTRRNMALCASVENHHKGTKSTTTGQQQLELVVVETDSIPPAAAAPSRPSATTTTFSFQNIAAHCFFAMTTSGIKVIVFVSRKFVEKTSVVSWGVLARLIGKVQSNFKNPTHSKLAILGVCAACFAVLRLVATMLWSCYARCLTWLLSIASIPWLLVISTRAIVALSSRLKEPAQSTFLPWLKTFAFRFVLWLGVAVFDLISTLFRSLLSTLVKFPAFMMTQGRSSGLVACETEGFTAGKGSALSASQSTDETASESDATSSMEAPSSDDDSVSLEDEFGFTRKNPFLMGSSVDYDSGTANWTNDASFYCDLVNNSCTMSIDEHIANEPPKKESIPLRPVAAIDDNSSSSSSVSSISTGSFQSPKTQKEMRSPKARQTIVNKWNQFASMEGEGYSATPRYSTRLAKSFFGRKESQSPPDTKIVRV